MADGRGAARANSNYGEDPRHTDSEVVIKGLAPVNAGAGIRRMTVLVVEADKDSADLLIRLLKAMGHAVVVVADGHDAWALLQGRHVDLVFSDWMMPGLDGQELCRRIRGMSGRPYTYIIGVTARGGQDNRLDALAAGADDFLTKPFDQRELVARLDMVGRLLAMQEELERKNEALRALATTDELTGLKNRRRFFEDLHFHFAQAALGQSPSLLGHFSQATRQWSPLSLILLDVDHFKAYNDAFGHPAGDDVLRGIAEVLRGGTRDYDTVARHGGEEFAVLLPRTGLDVALILAERLREAVERRDWPHRAVTASFGVATMTLGTGEAGDLVEQADRALYVSKRGGRNRIAQYTDTGDGLGAAPSAGASKAGLVQVSHLGDPSGQIPTCDDIVDGWTRVLVLRDSETVDHSRRVTAMMLVLARALGIDEAEMLHIRRGALLHDIGKIGVPDSILLKPGPLSEEEWAVMRLHPGHAYDLLTPVAFLRPALDIPYGHHEWWDGSGYPRGLAGEQIPLVARAFAAVDVWDALSHDRPYRKAWSVERVSAHIGSLAGTHLDPRIIGALQGIFAADRDR